MASVRWRVLTAAVIAVLVAIGSVEWAGAANAGPRSDIRSVSLKNVTVPGSTCDARHPIRLHHGKGRGAKFGQGHLILDAGHPVYGDISHDGRTKAFLPLACDTGGGTGASQVKFTYAVFADQHGHARLLGVIAARHQWRDAHATLLALKVRHHQARVTEYVYGPADADCCSSFVAHSTWVARSGALHLVHTALVRSDLLEGPRSLGRARLGMTTHQLRSAYGNATPGDQLGRHCYEWTFGREYDQSEQASHPAYAVFDHGRLTTLRPSSNSAATNHGAGMYTSLSALRHIYPHRVTVSHAGRGAGKDGYALVHLPHSWLRFHLAHDRIDGHDYVYANSTTDVWGSKPHGSGC